MRPRRLHISEVFDDYQRYAVDAPQPEDTPEGAVVEFRRGRQDLDDGGHVELPSPLRCRLRGSGRRKPCAAADSSGSPDAGSALAWGVRRSLLRPLSCAVI